MLKDLNDALYYALPSEIKKTHHSGDRWVLAGADKFLDVNKEKNSFLAIQYHLYEHPLYQCVSSDEETINVLVLGFENYGQKFLDACLQDGQICNKKLSVTVASDNMAEYKGIYIKERSALGKYFDIDGSLKGDESAYGCISFKRLKLRRDNKIASSDMERVLGTIHPHYVFVALGDDELNEKTADMCAKIAGDSKILCAISYISESRRALDREIGCVLPIYVNKDIKENAIYNEIERMAFNTHLVWEKSLNIDYHTVRAAFRKPYNHNSSVSFIVALKYKLFSTGIDLDEVGFERAAVLFSDRMSTDTDMKNKLIWIEHRRWVTEKLCNGYRGMSVEEAAGGNTRDAKSKKHICVLKSNPDQRLREGNWAKNNYEKWMSATDEELGRLDELDCMSVKLHRLYVKKAEDVKRKNLLNNNSIKGIKGLINDSKKASSAFEEWLSCMKDIWNGDKNKVRLYERLKISFLNVVNELDLMKEKKRTIHEYVKAFEVMFKPVLESEKYRVWNDDDVEFIENIPFVLTYTGKINLIIPLAAGELSAVFGNVAVATVVSPARIIYLCLVNREQDAKDLAKSLFYVIKYMKKSIFVHK